MISFVNEKERKNCTKFDFEICAGSTKEKKQLPRKFRRK